MKTILFACLATLAIAAPALARCDDNVSYMINKYGQCVDLTDITTIGALAAQRESLVKEASPIVLDNLKFYQDDVLKLVYIRGTATNRSSSPVRLVSARINLSKMRDGKRVNIGVETVYFSELLQPGESTDIKKLIDRPREQWWATDLSAGQIDYR